MRRLKIRDVGLNFGIALAAGVLALALAELVLRHFDPAPRPNPRGQAAADRAVVHRKSADPELVYELVPGARGERDGVTIVINSSGFRDDEFSEPPPPGMRIVVLGDSVAWGWGVPMEAAFPQALEARLRGLATEPYASSVVYNLAVDGYGTLQEVRLLETRGLALNPDLVVVSYILNDPDLADGGLTDHFVSRIEVLDLAKRAVRYAWERFRDHPKEYHHRVHARYRDEIEKNFQRLGLISRDRRVPIVVAVTPVFRFQPPYPWRDVHDLIRGLCEANGLLFLDLYPAFEPLDMNELSFDVWHPTVKGHAVIAGALLDFVVARSPVR